MTTTSAQIVHALRWNAVVRATAQLIGWLITIVTMRLLRPADYGLMNLAEIFMGLCVLVNHLGTIPALIQHRDIDETLIRKTFGLVLLSNAGFYMIAFFGAPYFAAFFGDARLAAILRILALGLIIGAFSAVPGVLLQRELKFKSISLIEFAAGLTGAAMTLVLALEGCGVWSLVLGNLTLIICATSGLFLVTRFRVAPDFNFVGLGRLFSFGMKVSGSGIVWYFNRNIDALLVGKVLGKGDLGYYSVANTLALMPVTKIMGLTNQIAFAAYSRIQDDRSRIRRYFLESAGMASLVFFPAAWGMSAVAGDFVDVVLGPRWHEVALVLAIVAFGVPFRALTMLMGPLVDGVGEPGVGLKNTLTTSLIVPAASLAGLYWGLIGLCIAALAGILLAVIIILRRNLTLLGIGYRELWSAIFPPMFAAAAMYATVLVARVMLLNTMPAPYRLPALIVLGASVYGAMTLLFNRSIVLRSLQLIRGTI
ncbi:MAG: lipopolysaccharide biosynthesis protein [Stellaceae bacterium]